MQRFEVSERAKKKKSEKKTVYLRNKIRCSLNFKTSTLVVKTGARSTGKPHCHNNTHLYMSVITHRLVTTNFYRREHQFSHAENLVLFFLLRSSRDSVF